VPTPSKAPKPLPEHEDQAVERHYRTIEEMEEEKEAENLHIRKDLPEGFSPLLKDKGDFDQVPLSVINNPRINIEQ
jgi:hypothetical protein